MAFDYEIELRNKAGNHLAILKRDAQLRFWRYDGQGGCGDCEIILQRDFDDYGDIGLDYDVRIYETIDTNFAIKGSEFDVEFGAGQFGGGGAQGAPLPVALPFQLLGVKKLRYAGFVREIRPVLDMVETVRLSVSGYSRQLEYVVVPDQVYSSMDVGAAARSIIDSYVLPGTQIKRTAGLNLCQDTGVSISATGLRFDTSAYEALATLADIGGNAEWGVTADREIYFLPRSLAPKQTWTIGDRVQFFEPTTGSTDDIIHRVYLRGGSGYERIVDLTSREAGFYKERVVLVPSISNDDDATLWGLGYAARFGQAKSSGRLKIAAVDVERSGLSNWIERSPNQTMPPLGLLRVLGGPTFLRAGAALPVQLPLQLNAAVVGGTTDQSFRINTIQYQPSDGGLTIDVDLGERKSHMADFQRGIEFKISELRQRFAA